MATIAVNSWRRRRSPVPGVIVDGASSVEAPYTYFPSGTSTITPGTGDLRLRQEFTAMVAVRNNVL